MSVTGFGRGRLYDSEPKGRSLRSLNRGEWGMDLKEDHDDVVADKFRNFVRREGRNLRTIFEQFDRNGDGKLSGMELWRAARNMGMELTDMEINALVWRFDMDGDGLVSFLEFEAFMEQNEMKESELDDVLDELRRRVRSGDTAARCSRARR